MCKMNKLFLTLNSFLFKKKPTPFSGVGFQLSDFSLQNLYFILSLLSNQENCIAQH